MYIYIYISIYVYIFFSFIHFAGLLQTCLASNAKLCLGQAWPCLAWLVARPGCAFAQPCSAWLCLSFFSGCFAISISRHVGINYIWLWLGLAQKSSSPSVAAWVQTCVTSGARAQKQKMNTAQKAARGTAAAEPTKPTLGFDFKHIRQAVTSWMQCFASASSL